jgi:hypothetical protein
VLFDASLDNYIQTDAACFGNSGGPPSTAAAKDRHQRRDQLARGEQHRLCRAVNLATAILPQRARAASAAATSASGRATSTPISSSR